MTTPIASTLERLPRPQRVFNGRLSVPTASALLLQQTHAAPERYISAANRRSVPLPSLGSSSAQDTISSKAGSSSAHLSRSATTTYETPLPEIDPLQHSAVQSLGPMVTLGTFTQDRTRWIVRAQRGRRNFVMVKRLDPVLGQAETRLLRGLNHRNIARLVHSYMENEVRCIALEYCRFTVAEILHVHLRLEEPQLQLIARSVFDALSYLDQHKVAHNHVHSKSIRITTPDIRVVLSDFEMAKNCDPASQNKDLTDLAFVLLDCMEGHILPADKRSTAFISQQRDQNKVFGLRKAELWSGSKQLIDFLDDLFNANRSAHTKLTRPHKYVGSRREDPECLRPYLELVNFECSTVWEGGQLD